MRFNITKNAFYEVLGYLKGIIPTNSALPMMQNFFLSGHDGKLTIVGTDQDNTIRVEMPADVVEPGDIVLPFKFLYDTISNIPVDSVLVFEKKDDFMSINSGKNKFDVVFADSRDYPQPPKFNETYSFTLETKLLSDIIKKTQFAACHDKTRIHMAGLNFRIMQNILHVAGTDSKRLSYIKVPVQSEKECQFTIPLETLKQVRLLCDKYDKVDVVLTDDENQIVFRFDGVIYYSRLLNDEFPDYLNIIPSDFQTRIVVGKENFKDILRMAKPVALASSIKALNVKVDESQLFIGAYAEEQGQFKTSLDVDKQGENTDINFNIDYFYQVLEVLSNDVLEIDFNGKARPAAIREKDNDQFVYIVMPIRG